MKEELHGSPNNEGEFAQGFETSLEKYTSAIVAAAKEEYKSPLQPFSVREREIRKKVNESFLFFKKSFSNGYRTLIEELQFEMKISESKEDLLALVAVDPKKLKIFEDVEKLIEALEAGSAIYELLGFTEKSLNVCYHAVQRLVENKEFEKAHDVCYFLIIIAPGVYQFWVYLGRCDASLQAYESAFQELAMAIEIDPTEATAYLDIIDILLETHEYTKAFNLCDAGLQFAVANQQEPWAEALRSRLEGKMNDVHIASRNL